MGSYIQAARALTLTSPLEPDALLIESFSGKEAISELFEYQLGLLAPLEVPIDFKKIVGQPVSVELSLSEMASRSFHGIVRRLTKVRRDDSFTYFRAEAVPAVWTLTQNSNCRIFQQKSVPDILREIFAGFEVAFDLHGRYFPHNYCVQYGESDFAFASRLMEEEGIHYYFKHDKQGHKLVIADRSLQSPRIAGRLTIPFDNTAGGGRRSPRITDWSVSQEIHPGKHTLRDHSFQLPAQTLDANASFPGTIRVGEVLYSLHVGNSVKLERFDYPGGFAHRFDGIHPHGSDQSQMLHDVFDDNRRTAALRMEEEASQCLSIEGTSDSPQMLPGHGFTLINHFDSDGDYVLTRVEHSITLSDYRSGQGSDRPYENHFTCIPRDLPYRPRRLTPRPVIHGTQTATVVGTATASDQEISCDKYGRVKVQFHWDRAGTSDLNSSCWVRVMQSWAGAGFGALQLPRIGHEVVIGFEEGDPDAPIVLGSVYNASNMPPYKLPDDRAISGFRSRTKATDSTSQHFNHFYFDDTDGRETVRLHSENRLHQSAKESMVQLVGWGAETTSGHRGEGATGSGEGGESSWEAAKTEKIKGNNLETVWGQSFEFVVGAKEEVIIGGDLTGIVGGKGEALFGLNCEIIVGGDVGIKAGGQAEVIIGDKFEWIVGGGTYEYIKGDESCVIGGSFYKKVEGSRMATMFNGQVVEYLDASGDGEYKRLVFNGIDTLVEAVHGANPLAEAKQRAIDTAVAAAVATIAPQPEALAHTINQQTALLSPPITAAYDAGYTVVSEAGNIILGNLHAGGKITLQADTIELLCDHYILKYKTDSNVTTPDAVARFDAGKLVLEQTKAKIELLQEEETAVVGRHLDHHAKAMGKALLKSGVTMAVIGAATAVTMTEVTKKDDYFKD